MKGRRYVAVLIFGLLLGGVAVVSERVGGVRAYDLQTTDTPVPSATVTGAPWFSGVSTVTPQATPGAFGCPVGTPVGWGTTTPGVLWSSACARCVGSVANTATTAPTDNPITQTVQAMTATVTATPTGLPTATATTSAVLTWTGSVGSPSCGYGYGAPPWSYTESAYSSNGLRLDVQSSWGTLNQCLSKTFVWSDSRGAGNQTYHLIADTYSGGTFAFAWFYEYPTQRGLCSGSPCVGIGYHHWDYTFTWDQRYLAVSWATSGQGGTKTIGGTWYIWPGTGGVPPTPNAGYQTPVAGGYCSTVQGEGDSGFGYSGISYGTTACFDIGPVDWSTVLPSWITGAITLPNIPWLAHICLQDVDLGSVTLFGLNFSFLTGVVVMGVVLAIQIMIRK